MSEACSFCGGPVNPHDISTWRMVKGWVHGAKAHGMTLRENVDQYAHNHCIIKARDGQAPDQPEMFEIQDGSVSLGVTKVMESFDGQ